jgi:hypothetical protein
MLTVFTIPKAFKGHSGVIQRNALASWCRLRPRCEVILCGNDPGTKEAAAEFGVTHLPDIECNEFGTPLISSAFGRAADAAKSRLLCYVNADIILLDDFVDAAERVGFPDFLMVSRRWDVDIRDVWDFGHPDAEERVRDLVGRTGKLRPPMWIDCFVFPRAGALTDLPPFAVGRTSWDNWFIFRARQLGLPVIDATPAVTLVHQNHDYSHVPARFGTAWEGPEVDRNRALVGGGWERFYQIHDATHVLTPTALRPARGRPYLLRQLQALPWRLPYAAGVAAALGRVSAARWVYRRCRYVATSLPEWVGRIVRPSRPPADAPRAV